VSDSRESVQGLLTGPTAKPAGEVVHLPVLDIDVVVVPPSPSEQIRIGMYAAAGRGGRDDDEAGLEVANRVFTGGLRFCLVDENGAPLLDSFRQVGEFLRRVDPADAAVILSAYSRAMAAAPTPKKARPVRKKAVRRG